MKRRILNLLIALDQLAWVLLTLGNGMPDETISAALYRMELQGKWAGRLFRPVVDVLFWFDDEHCYHSWKAEISKAQLPGIYK
jgi:hypothetical protein